MNLPTLVYHADWSSSPAKRWCAKATLGSDGRYTASAPQPVGELAGLLKNLRSEAGKESSVFAGFDFPIGVPEHYAKRARIANFPEFLSKLGTAGWEDFYSVCETPEQVSIHRPFFPFRYEDGCSQQQLLNGHDAQNIEALLRRCELGGEGKRQACSLFWTIGGNQVGKAAIVGWRDVLAPALGNDSAIRLWPFEGLLPSLLAPGALVVAETYPAECYGWFSDAPLGSKGDPENRKKFGALLLAWAGSNNVIVDSGLDKEMRGGYLTGEDDAFDAVVGLFGMLQVCIEQRLTGEPRDKATSEVEGWILGRQSSSSVAMMVDSTSERLQNFGKLLHQLFLDLPDHNAVTDTLDYMLGALYGLSRAHQLGFRDRPGGHFPIYRPHLANYALEVPKGREIDKLWSAGFYFNSSIQRIASAFDRIPRMLGARMEKNIGGKKLSTSAKDRMREVSRKPFTKWEQVYDEVNAFKHAPEGRAAGRTVTMADAIESFEQMLNLLTDGKQTLVTRYK